MKIRVLGCYGNEYPGYRTTCVLINETMTIDAGALTGYLGVAEQSRIRHILLTHSHLDHVLDVGFLADNIIGHIAQPVEIVGTKSSLDALMKYVLNNRIWPDFTKIPTPDAPVLRLRRIKQREEFQLAGLKIRAIPLNHTVSSSAYVLTDESGASMIFCSDSGPTREIWNVANKSENLRAVFIETSFPNSMQEIADVSHHLTPRTMAKELEKLNDADKLEIYIHHMKPLYLKQIRKEIKALKLKNIRVLDAGMEIVV